MIRFFLLQGFFWLACAAVSAGELSRCARLASEKLGVPDAVLAAVILTEGGWPGLAKPNSDARRTYDYGVMQINSYWWAPEFEKYGIQAEDLRDDVCTNVAAGAWILKKHHQDTGSWIEAMLRYHSRNPTHQRRYLASLRKSLQRLKAAQD